MKSKTAPGTSRIASLLNVLGLIVTTGLLVGLLTPPTLASSRLFDDPGQEMLKAAIADVEKMLAEERSWVGRPHSDQFTPLAGLASGFEPYTADTVAIELIYYRDNLAELSELPAEEEDRFVLQAGLSSTFQWSARLVHTSDALSVLHLEFLQTQKELEDEYKQQIDDYPDRPVPEAFKERLREQLAGQEQQALNQFLTARVGVVDELRHAKAALAERIRTWIVQGDEANLNMAEAVFSIVIDENEWNQPFDMMRTSLCRLKYYKLTQADLAGMEDSAALHERDDNDPQDTLVVMVPDVRTMMPSAPFAPAPRTHGVTSDRPSYGPGEVVTIDVQGSHEYTPTDDVGYRLEIHNVSVLKYVDIRGQPDIPPMINEGRTFDPPGEAVGAIDDEVSEDAFEDDPVLEIPDRDEETAPEEPVLRLPAIFPLTGANPQVIIRGFPKGEFVAMVIERGSTEGFTPFVYNVLAQVEFTIGAKAAPATLYHDYIINPAATKPIVEQWGTGIPSAATNDWSKLILQEVIQQHKLNGRWILLAVHGRLLFAHQLENAQVTWAAGDQHLDYRLLHKGTFTMDKAIGIGDEDWSGFWKAFGDRLGLDRADPPPDSELEGRDVYLVAVRLGPQTWAGGYQFKIGDMWVDWTLPKATNIAHTRFVRGLDKPARFGVPEEYVHANALFLYDRFYVEIHTTADVVTSDRIPLDLFRSIGGADPVALDYGSHPLYAERVAGNRRHFRSPLIRANIGRAKPGSQLVDGKRVYWVPMNVGDRLAARVIPHDVAEQGPMAVASVYSAPDKVGAFWRGAVVQAAVIAELEPPRPDHQGDIDSIIREPWTTVDSTPFVQVGGREVKLKIGHLAAMLLIRNQFIATMEAQLPRLQQLRDKVNTQPGWGHAIWAMLREDAERPQSPIGDLEVLDWDPMRRITIRGQTVPFRNAYDEEWLNKTFRGFTGHQAEWQEEMALFVFRGYVDSAERALEYARTMDPSEADDLLKLTGIGMRGMVDRARPNMLRLVPTPESTMKFRWEYDFFSRQYVDEIEALGKEFLKNEAHVDDINNATAIVAAVVGLLMPEVYIGQVIGTALSVGGMTLTLVREVPEFFGREAEVQFAIGAYLAIGEERYIRAELRRKPGWAMALELAGGGFDLVANVARLRHVRTLGDSFATADEAAELLAQPARNFAMAEHEAQVAALSRFARVVDMQAAGQTLSEAETLIFRQGSRLIDEIETLGDITPTKLFDRRLAEEAETVIMRGNRMDFVTPNEAFETRRLRPTDDAFNVPAPTDGPVTKRDTWEMTLTGTLPPGQAPTFALPPGQPWAEFDIGAKVGQGAVCQVLRVTDAVDDAGRVLQRQVLKVTRNLESSAEDIARMRHCAELIDEIVPQIKINRFGNVGKVGFMLQDEIPEGSVLLTRLLGDIPGDTLPASTKFRRTIGVVDPDGLAGPMTKAQTHAFCDLYKRMIDEDIVWFDGHFGNIVLVEENGKLVGKVLDQDFMWKWGENFLEGPVGSQAGVLDALYGFQHDYFKLRMQSMTSHHAPWQVQRLVERGTHAYPNARFFMYKMMERWGFVNYVPGQGFVDGAMKMQDVLDIFPDFRKVSVVDPDLGAMLRENGILRPGGGLPGGGVPQPEPAPEPIAILPFIEIEMTFAPQRIAA